jgi:CHAT domain-containing protein
MRIRLFLLLLCVVITCIPLGQNKNEALSYLALYHTAEKLYNAETTTRTSDSLAFHQYTRVIDLLKDRHINDSILFDANLKAGIISLAEKNDRGSLNFFLNCNALKKTAPSLPDSVLFRSYLFTGNAYHNLFNMDSALDYYNQAEVILNSHPSIMEGERLYNQTGVLYYETGDYDKSIIYFTKALSIAQHQESRNKYFIVFYQNNIASAYRKLGNFDEALNLYKSLLPYNINEDELAHNIGVTFLEAGNYPQAILWLKKVSYSNQSKLNDVGRAFLLAGNNDSALRYFNASVSVQQNLHASQKNFEYAYTLKYLGDIAAKNHAADLALNRYQQAIIQADPDFNDSDISSNPQAFVGLHQTFFLFDALVAKAAAQELKSTQQDQYQQLQHSFATYGSALALAHQVEKMYSSDESKLFLKKGVDSIYKVAVDIGLRLYEMAKDTATLAKVLTYIEDDKASVLQADLRELELGNIEGLPKGLLQEEKKLKSVIAGLNNKVSQSNDSSISRQLFSSLQDAQIQLSTVQARLNDNPAYYKLRFHPTLINIPVLQQHLLQKDEAILSYYYTASRLLCFYITRDDFGYSSRPFSDTLSKKIYSVRKELGLQDEGDKKVINEISSWLYGYLVQPMANHLKNARHLVVIPYNEISYVPFEILNDAAADELLVHRFAISYNYSINFLQRYKPGDASYKVLAFAPFTTTTNSSTYPLLKASQDEVSGLPGKVLVSEEATKDNFMKLASGYPIIHLATHAIVSNSDPLKSFIAFYQGGVDTLQQHDLYENEIYNLDMGHNELVILSACETGNGQMINGEGIISLSRAFFYAGCKSVMTSLWKAEDRSITFITKRIHTYLAKGYAKDEALQRAKTDYLESPDIDPRFKTPAYWAPLVLTGDFNPVIQSGASLSKVATWLASAVALLLLLLAVLLRRRGRK